MAIDFDAQVHLADLRMRVLNGEKISATEYRDLFLDLRRGRDMTTAASKASAAKARKANAPSKPSKPKLNIQELFSGHNEAGPISFTYKRLTDNSNAIVSKGETDDDRNC